MASSWLKQFFWASAFFGLLVAGQTTNLFVQEQAHAKETLSKAKRSVRIGIYKNYKYQ